MKSNRIVNDTVYGHIPYDGKKTLLIDEVSIVRKRLQSSRANSVPFFIFSNQKALPQAMRERLKKILFEVFS